ncbi:nuclear receptor-like protein [Leptotrombidium deliense]|uniref:Nuclear receptor-like protein n=1 Tax=Leptotrombidium deliense TaxID=299467 RepID=A0A443SU81_9ACAR|nr:nuclear receptor-like protein [Leptotrombidium deliense]
MKQRQSLDTMRNMDDSDDCRSLVCDQKGVIIAESVYRCMVCAKVSDTIRDAKIHYKNSHIDDDEQFEFNTNSSSDDLFAYNDNETETQGKRKSPFSSHLEHKMPEIIYSPVLNTASESESDSFQKFCAKVMRQEELQSVQDEQKLERKHTENNISPPPLITMFCSDVTLPRGGTTGAVGKSGYISCAVCGVIRYYSCIYRRYGQFTCQVCYRFFRTFFLKPKRYFCRTLGKCPLNVRNRCRACWIKSCIGLYAVDGSRQQILEEYQPQKGDIDSQRNKMSQFAETLQNTIENGTNMSRWTVSMPSSITITSKVPQSPLSLNSMKSNRKSITL